MTRTEDRARASIDVEASCSARLNAVHSPPHALPGAKLVRPPSLPVWACPRSYAHGIFPEPPALRPVPFRHNCWSFFSLSEQSSTCRGPRRNIRLQRNASGFPSRLPPSSFSSLTTSTPELRSDCLHLVLRFLHQARRFQSLPSQSTQWSSSPPHSSSPSRRSP